MSNPFLLAGTRDIATAKLYEKAVIADLEKIFHTNAPALTDGNKIYVNIEDNLFKAFPNYNQGMLKWLLWHEQQHLNLKHHDRFYRYLDDLGEAKTLKEFHVTKDEVNIIMDILVHDSLCKWFPELIETAKENYAQLRYRNSLTYTFKTFTLEEMLDEYARFKAGLPPTDSDSGDGEDKDGEDKEDKKSKDKDSEKDSKGKKKEDSKEMRKDESKTGRKAHKETDRDSEDKPEKHEVDETPDEPGTSDHPEFEHKDEHEDVDWEKAKEIDNKEFITKKDGEKIQKSIAEIKRKKLRLARIAETLNGLATDQRMRTYAVPSKLQVGKGVILKGRKPGKAKLYLIFDASGSMDYDMDTFKKIIKDSIPQALEAPCEWFSGYNPDAVETKCQNKSVTYCGRHQKDYYKGKFKDFMKVHAYSGYNDDGDRVLDLCLKAEEKGYNPIGVTDGGGCLKHPETLKKLKRTVIVGDGYYWLKKIKEINPAVQTIYTGSKEED